MTSIENIREKPTKVSDEIRVLEYISEHGSITVRQAEDYLRINSPTKVLSNIRKNGRFTVMSRWQTNPNTQTRYKEYWIA